MKFSNLAIWRSSKQVAAAIAWTSTTLALIFVVGCTPDTASKTSLFEHDHEVAKHWPDDLADVAVKLRERIGRDDASERTRLKVKELVSWTAEVAADTNLAEADWLPLYHASESLAANLRAAHGELTDENCEQIESLCELVDQAVGKTPERLPNVMKGQP
tara:strand:- start:70 stop:549 length:480 start_codon:yes stop_codon:yes gene_type:complete